MSDELRPIGTVFDSKVMPPWWIPNANGRCDGFTGDYTWHIVRWRVVAHEQGQEVVKKVERVYLDDDDPRLLAWLACMYPES